MDRPERIGNYLVERELGRGGGGIVYLARDVDLERAVAIKTLPPDVARDSGRLEQLEREAKVLATLSHPNVATIHGLLKDGAERYLVLEYVPGHSLDELLGRAPLPVDQALRCARDVADGLEAAHEKGIVHRDLKPANVRRTDDGVVKVLDFGLAKEVGEDLAGATRSGHTSAIVGTPAYLSPEQIRGRPADRGADVWAFGCLLYELLAGRAAFRGASVGDLLQAVLEAPVDLGALPPRTPPRVVELIRRCLHRDRRQRLRDLGDARLELDQALEDRSSSTSVPPVQTPVGSRGFVLGLVLATAAIAVLVGWWLGARAPGAAGARSVPMRLGFQLMEGEQAGELLFDVDALQMSPQGDRFAVRGEQDGVTMVFVRELDSFEAQAIPGTAGARRFCFSPDGRQLAVALPVSEQSNELQLIRVQVDGGSPPVTLGKWFSRPMIWIDDEIVSAVGPPARLVSMPAGGGDVTVQALEWPGDTPSWGPQRLRVLRDGTLMAQVDSFRDVGYELSIATVDRATGEVHVVMQDAGSGRLSPGGNLLFTRSDQLFAVPWDSAAREPRGEPVRVADGLRTRDSWSHAEIWLGDNGVLAFLDGGVVGAGRQLVEIREGGAAKPWCADRMPFEERLAATDEADWVVVTRVSTNGFFQAWGSRLSQPGMQLLHSEDGGDVHHGYVTPDGEWLLYQLTAQGAGKGVYRMRLDGSGRPELLVAARPGTNEMVPRHVSNDGALLLVEEFAGGTYALELVNLADPEHRSLRFAEGRTAAPGCDMDASGRWICHTRQTGGASIAVVRRFDREAFVVGPEQQVRLSLQEAPHSVSWWHGGEAQQLTLVVWCAISRRVYLVPCTEMGQMLQAGEPRLHVDMSAAPTVDWDLLADGRVLAISPDPLELADVDVKVITDIDAAIRAVKR